MAGPLLLGPLIAALGGWTVGKAAESRGNKLHEEANQLLESRKSFVDTKASEWKSAWGAVRDFIEEETSPFVEDGFSDEVGSGVVPAEVAKIISRLYEARNMKETTAKFVWEWTSENAAIENRAIVSATRLNQSGHQLMASLIAAITLAKRGTEHYIACKNYLRAAKHSTETTRLHANRASAYIDALVQGLHEDWRVIKESIVEPALERGGERDKLEVRRMVSAVRIAARGIADA